VDLTAFYLKAGFDRPALIETLANGATKLGNDPHSQELGRCLLEDYLHTQACDRDRLLLLAVRGNLRAQFHFMIGGS